MIDPIWKILKEIHCPTLSRLIQLLFAKSFGT